MIFHTIKNKSYFPLVNMARVKQVQRKAGGGIKNNLNPNTNTNPNPINIKINNLQISGELKKHTWSRDKFAREKARRQKKALEDSLTPNENEDASEKN
jgi:hypothetical protein